ncbi:iron-siderophore ABC transporter substrate-binding protein [Chlorogloeopsis sp. ULAP01]|uniref:iron-siderophore ABC transporter substrate-binding protein n=1 Tax=Chlorogloeopsis sp. ULAP01 TaxID=3056483 RepID=UPI0025AB1518|nr:iron-siderophore ABC transporter substrate-binding protein [Chlorogloeopsis sp. ULAP01]MDM9379784.1 iron-siderophore ABC transporter substrate-binding protein [Chlorogloeopsis sp. ULAP01]
MKEQADRITKLVLPLAFSLFLTTACHQFVSQKSHPSLKPSVECRVIQHELGKTCVPMKPQRIVVLEPDFILNPLIALGIKPIGYASINFEGKEIFLGLSPDDVTGATNVGNYQQPSLEKILMLKPDLILSTEHNPYSLLNAIAPTVPVPSDTAVSGAFFKENLRYVANVVGEQTKAEEVLRQYQNRIKDLKNRLGNQLEQIEVSVIHYGNGYVYTPATNHDAVGNVLIDAGIRHKLPPPGKTISLETIEEYDADILFIINLERRSLGFFLQHPIFSCLKAVKNKRVYLVPSERWDVRGMLGANKILDDLFKYLPH